MAFPTTSKQLSIGGASSSAFSQGCNIPKTITIEKSPLMTILIRPETIADFESIQRVNRQAFGQAAEAQLVDDLRAGGFVRVSMIAELDGQVVGHILFSQLTITSDVGSTLALSLAPLAVLPNFQRQGIGQSLVAQGLQECQRQGHPAVIVLGDPQYYRRFGFAPELAARLESPYAGEFFMALELVPGALQHLAGRVNYPPPFNVLA